MPFATTSHFSSTSGSESDIILKAGTPEKSVSSPLLSLTRSVISYVTSTFLLFANHLYVFTYENGFAEPSIPTEPMTLMTHVSSKLILIPNKPTTDKVDPPKAAPATATAQRQPPSFQLQHATRLQSSSYLSLRRHQVALQQAWTSPIAALGFDVTLSIDSIAWTNVPRAGAADAMKR